MRQHAVCRVTLALITLLAAVPLFAQTYPTKPIQVIIGFPPGTVVDVVARAVGNEMAKRLGQPIVLEFKPGASGTIGAKYVVNARPDGFTLYYGNTLISHALFNKENAVDAAKELAPVSRFVTVPFFFVARASLPVQSLPELIAYTKANPEQLKYGAPSQTTDLIMQMLKNRSGISARSIPYKGAPQAVVALLGGEIDLGFAPVQPYLSNIQAGSIRALFVASPKRFSVLPNVPTAAELGLPNLELAFNFGLWAPLGTPQDIRSKLSAEAVAALRIPAIVEQLRNGAAAEPVGSTPEEQLRSFEAEVSFWTEAAQAANFQH